MWTRTDSGCKCRPNAKTVVITNRVSPTRCSSGDELRELQAVNWTFIERKNSGCVDQLDWKRPPRLVSAALISASDYHFGHVTLVRVVDGDTVRLSIDVGFGIARLDQSYRLAGINAPELPTPEGKLAKQALEQFLVGKKLAVDVSTADKYGRYLVEIFANGENVNLWMIANKFAVPYMTGAA